MKTLRRTGALAGLAILATVPMVGGAAAQTAPSPACGQTITVNTTLTADLGPCPNYGLKVGADNITLDLNGFRIFGVPAAYDNAGVYALGRTGVTVRNGRVTNFDAGVAIEGGSHNLVTGITANDNQGLQHPATGNTRFGDGIAVLSSTDNRIIGNETANNGPFAGIGIYSDIDPDHTRATSGVSTRNLIDGNNSHDNVVSRAGTVNFAATEADGVRLEPGTVGNIVSNNQLWNNGLDGVAAFNTATDNVIRGNVIFGNGRRTGARRGDGVRVFGQAHRTLVENNRITGNGGNGIIIQSQSNTIRFNQVIGNGLLPPLNPSNPNTFTFDLFDGNVNCDANVWLANMYRTTRLPCSAAGGVQV